MKRQVMLLIPKTHPGSFKEVEDSVAEIAGLISSGKTPLPDNYEDEWMSAYLDLLETQGEARIVGFVSLTAAFHMSMMQMEDLVRRGKEEGDNDGWESIEDGPK